MAYGRYSSYGTAPSAPNPIVPANPIHEVVDAFRPDFMPLQDTSSIGNAPSLYVSWDDYAPPPGDPSYVPGRYERAEAAYGQVTRDRDKERFADRPVNVPSYELRWADEFGDPRQGELDADLIVNQTTTPYYYDDLDVPGGFIVERRGSDIQPSEAAYKGAGNFNPGANSIPANNPVLDRWDHDSLKETGDFGPALQHGTEVIVTVDRPMQQPYGGNLVEGLKMYPHPLGDNILQAPIGPSQFPDRAMEIPDPYLPGSAGGIHGYRDTSRAVYPDPATDVTTQAFAEALPAGAASYDNSWE